MNESIGCDIAAVTASLSVPSFDFAAIRNRVAREAFANDTPRRRPWWPLVGILAIPCLVAAATIFPTPAVRDAIEHQMYAWAKTAVPLPNGVPRSITFTRLEPTSLRDAVASAHFHLVLPQGLPKGWSLRTLSTDNTGLSYSAEYRTPGGTSVTFDLARAVPHATYVSWVGRFDGAGDGITKVARIPTRVWIVGNEVMRVAATALTQAQAVAVLRATRAHPASLIR